VISVVVQSFHPGEIVIDERGIALFFHSSVIQLVVADSGEDETFVLVVEAVLFR
jgi:hypothetical protein